MFMECWTRTLLKFLFGLTIVTLLALPATGRRLNSAEAGPVSARLEPESESMRAPGSESKTPSLSHCQALRTSERKLEPQPPGAESGSCACNSGSESLVNLKHAKKLDIMAAIHDYPVTRDYAMRRCISVGGHRIKLNKQTKQIKCKTPFFYISVVSMRP